MEHSKEFARILRLYEQHRITEAGLIKAVEMHVITEEEKEEILRTNE